MPDNQSSDNTGKGQWAELNNAEYNNYVQTLFYSQAQSLRIVSALNDQLLPAQATVKSLTRFRHRLHVKCRTESVERKTWNVKRRKL